MLEKVQLQDCPTKNDGDGFVTINGNVVEAFKFSKLEINTEMIMEEKRFLNARVEQSAVRGMKILGDIGYYATTKAFVKAVENYKNGGEYPQITIQGWATINGQERCEVLVTGVNLEKITLISLEEGSTDSSTHESSFKANDYQVIQ